MGCVLLGLATNTCTGRDQCQLQDGARHGDAADSRAHVATPTAPPGHGLVRITHWGVCFGRPYFYN